MSIADDTPVRVVSIHAPYIGSDEHGLRFRVKFAVSIHAPYIGSDKIYAAIEAAAKGFNPRSLHRERRDEGALCRLHDAFQSTLPT